MSAAEPWLSLCREAVGDVQAVLSDLPTRLEREPVIGDGSGGDETTAIDAAAEAAIVGRLEQLHASGRDFHLVSEELGERTFGEPDGTRVVVDPIDGSVNAKRGVPYFSLSIAVADGARMGDVHFGFVHDFGTREEWRAVRGGGAWLGNERLGAMRPKEEIELLGLEATLSSSVADNASAFAALAKRFRVMGSLALSLCHLAAGRVDAVCSLKAVRAVDVAAAQLLLREVGLAVVFADEQPFDDGRLDVPALSQVAAAATPELARRLAKIVA